MSSCFNSIFSQELHSFINYKRGLGLTYENEVSRLRILDNRLISLHLLTKEISASTFEYITRRNGMNEANYARQYGVTKDFCKYLISIEFPDVVFVDKQFKVVNNYVPTMFKTSDVYLLFKQCDHLLLQNQNNKFYRLYYGYSILFRLLYSSGLRISEALKIRYMDINLNDGTIKIFDSKNHTSRLIVVSDSMNKCLFDYIDIFYLRDNDFLFLNSKATVMSTKSVRIMFKKILQSCSLDVTSHVHDFRHVFTNSALDQMLSYGYDENTVIVYLYKYLGHKSIVETEYYIHFTESNHNKIIENSTTLSKKLYEGIDLNE